ncbi:hypothetical protein [Microbacterium capsulatum]|uniref:Uncharacterized protein n=1 Tax=Microbacterium capsulatum TaxID=3041921 RepID=A0ABU0XKN4_9MICO|nr:hypothetical protein [Microbacterium sp. ASV81]MDQ4215710.1 hypothetical protein [Microbacterium sp. ASV81]
MLERHVTILGEARVDEIRDPGGVRESVTGDAVELAHALRGHGLLLTVVAPVADDPDGERIRSVLQDRGIRLIALPAPDGTPRRSLVRDRTGVHAERQRGGGGPAETRRSLAAQAEADVIVDLRDRDMRTLYEERDDVLHALGLTAAEEEPSGSVVSAETEDAPAVAGIAAEKPSPLSPEHPDDAAPVPARVGPSRVLLPGPVVAGTVRHTPVRLLPDPPAAHEPVADWFGLEVRLARIAT